MKNVLRNQQGIALVGMMVLFLILSMLAAVLLSLGGQESLSAAVGREAAVSQQLADSASDIVVALFNNPQTTSPSLASVLSKQRHSMAGTPSFFDAHGRSQYVGTADHPDWVMQAKDFENDRLWNDPQTGLFRSLRDVGNIEEVKIYAPSRPGLLCSLETTVSAGIGSSRTSVRQQLAALDVPALLAAAQIRQDLGTLEPGNESPVAVHWGALRVGGNAVFRHANDVPTKSPLALVDGRAYNETLLREDRWMEGWIGGSVLETRPAPAQGDGPIWPHNLHAQQRPIPGVSLDEWPYEQLKRAAQQFGSYFGIDHDGLLYPQGVVQPGYGIGPDEALRDRHGLVFIDTLDRQPPRSDNLGTLTLRAAYLESLLVMQGHVVWTPTSGGASLSVLSPPLDPVHPSSRGTVSLSHVNLRGVLYAAGNILISGQARLFGAVVAAGTISPAGQGGTLEVWYDHDLGQGLYRGLPVVYRAPGTWTMK